MIWPTKSSGSHPRFYCNNLTIVINILLQNSHPIEYILKTISDKLKFFLSHSSSNNNSLVEGTNKTLVFVVNNKLNEYIKLHKDILLDIFRSNVVYQISCKNCNATYVGQTKRKLGTRIREHIKDINKNSN